MTLQSIHGHQKETPKNIKIKIYPLIILGSSFSKFNIRIRIIDIIII
jgi:hypothetical protein